MKILILWTNARTKPVYSPLILLLLRNFKNSLSISHLSSSFFLFHWDSMNTYVPRCSVSPKTNVTDKIMSFWILKHLFSNYEHFYWTPVPLRKSPIPLKIHSLSTRTSMTTATLNQAEAPYTKMKRIWCHI